MADSWVQFVAVYGLSPSAWQHTGDESSVPATQRPLEGMLRCMVPPAPPVDVDSHTHTLKEQKQWRGQGEQLIPFVFPSSIWLCDPAYGEARHRPLLHAFSTTLPDATPLYGHALTRMHPVVDRTAQAIMRMQAAAQLMHASEDAQAGVQAADAPISTGSVFAEADRAFEPSTLVVLTTEPAYEAMRAVLAALDEAVPQDEPFGPAHARALYRALLGDEVAGTHMENARAALSSLPRHSRALSLGVDLLDDAEDAEADGASASEVNAILGMSTDTYTPLLGPQDAVVAAAVSVAASRSNASLDGSFPSKSSLGSNAPRVAAGNELQFLQCPWLRTSSMAAEFRLANTATNVLVMPPSSCFSWELPQVDWVCAVCKEQIVGLSRDFLLSALATSIARKSTQNSPRQSPSSVLPGPLQDFIRCVETRGCVKCAAAGNDTFRQSGSGDAGAPAVRRQLTRRRSSRTVMSASPLSGSDESAPSAPVYDLLDDPLWPSLAPALNLHTGIVELLTRSNPLSELPFSPPPTANSVYSAALPFTLPSSSGLPPLDVDARQLFARVQPANIIAILTALLCERHVIVVSKDASILPDVMTTMLALLHPFEWVGSLIPVFPADYDLLDWLSAPLPKFWGVHSMVAQACAAHAWWDVHAAERDPDSHGVPRPYPASDSSGAGVVRESVLHELPSSSPVLANGDVHPSYWKRYAHIIQAPAHLRDARLSVAAAARGSDSVLGALAQIAHSFSKSLSSGMSDYVMAPTNSLLQSTWQWSDDSAARTAEEAETIGRKGKSHGSVMNERAAVAAIILDLDVDAVSPHYLPPTHLLPPRLSLRLWRAILHFANLYTWAHPERPMPPRLPDMPADATASERAMAESIYSTFQQRAAARGWDGVSTGALPSPSTPGAVHSDRVSVLYADSLFLPPVGTTWSAASVDTGAESARNVRRSMSAGGAAGSKPRVDRAAPTATIRTLDAVHSDDDADADDDEHDVTGTPGNAHAGAVRSALDVQPIPLTPPWALWRAHIAAQHAKQCAASARFLLAKPVYAPRPAARRGSSHGDGLVASSPSDDTTLIVVPEPPMHFTKLRLEFMQVMVSLFKAFRTYTKTNLSLGNLGGSAAAVQAFAAAREGDADALKPADSTSVPAVAATSSPPLALPIQPEDLDAILSAPPLQLDELLPAAEPVVVASSELAGSSAPTVGDAVNSTVQVNGAASQPTEDAVPTLPPDVALQGDASSSHPGTAVVPSRPAPSLQVKAPVNDDAALCVQALASPDLAPEQSLIEADASTRVKSSDVLFAAQTPRLDMPAPWSAAVEDDIAGVDSDGYSDTSSVGRPDDTAFDASWSAALASAADSAPSTAPPPPPRTDRGRMPPPAPPLMYLSIVRSPQALSSLEPLIEVADEVSQPSSSQPSSSEPSRAASPVLRINDTPSSRSRAVSSVEFRAPPRAVPTLGLPGAGERARSGSEAFLRIGGPPGASATHNDVSADVVHTQLDGVTADYVGAVIEPLAPMPFVGTLGPRTRSSSIRPLSSALSPRVLDTQRARAAVLSASLSPPATESASSRAAAARLSTTMPAPPQVPFRRGESAPAPPLRSLGSHFAMNATTSSLGVNAQVDSDTAFHASAADVAVRSNAVDQSPMAAIASLSRAAQLRRASFKVMALSKLRRRSDGASSASTDGGSRTAPDDSAPLTARVAGGSELRDPIGMAAQDGFMSVAELDAAVPPPADARPAVERSAGDDPDVFDIPSFDDSFYVEEFVASESALDAEPLVSHIVRQTQMFRMFIQDRVSREDVDLFERACYRRMTYRAWRHATLANKSITGCLFKAIRGTLCKNWERRLFELHNNVLAYYSQPERVLAAAEKVRSLRIRATAAAAVPAGAVSAEAATLQQELQAASAEYEKLRVRCYRKSFYIVPGRTEVVIPSTAGAQFRTPYVFQLINPALPSLSTHGELRSSSSEADAAAAATAVSSTASAASILRADAALAGAQRDVLTICADSAYERRQWILHLKARLRPGDAFDQLSMLYLDASHGIARKPRLPQASP